MSELYDLSSLHELTQGDKKQLKTLVDVFIENLEDNLDELKSAILNEDAKKIEFIAHKIKGASSQFNATRLSDIASELEAAGKNNAKLDQAKAKFDVLSQFFQEMKSEFNNEFR